MKIENFEDCLKKKASKSPSTYKISAIGFDKKGEVLGSVTNSYCMDGRELKHFGGRHAERLLISRYGALIKLIIICRVGGVKSGNVKLLPIKPCYICQKVADKLGIKIISLYE